MEVSLCDVVMYGVALLKTNVRFTPDGGQLCLMWMCMVWVFSRRTYGLPMMEVSLCDMDVYGVGLLKVKVRFTHDGGQLV